MNNILLISFTSFLQKYYQTLPEEIAKQSKEKIIVLVPPYRKELWNNKKVFLEERGGTHFQIKVIKTFFSSNLHFTVFRRHIIGILRKLQPAIVDIENEAFNIGTFQVVYLIKKFSPKSKIIIRASQNLFKIYPPPFNFIEKYNLKRLDGVLARNFDVVKVLRKKGFDKKIYIITHGVDFDAFKPNIKHNSSQCGISKPLVGYIGALTVQKDIETLLNAAVGLDCRLIIVGEGDQKQKLIYIAKKNNLDIKFIPAVSHEEVIKIMQKLDIFVLPSKTMPKLTEKFGRVLIEAMSCCTPVIGSNSGEIPHVIGDAGLIFKESDISDLREKLKLLLENNDKRTALGLKGRERVIQNYSWKVIATKTIKIYEELLK